MKILLLTDRTINKTLLGQVQLQLTNAYKDVKLEFIVEDFDYSTYPIEQYWGGYWGISTRWIGEQCAGLYKRYAEEINNVVFLVASPNWKLDDPNIVGDKRVWGWCHSNHFSGYGVQQVRFAQVAGHTDARNVNNSAGTLYHELMHDHDTFVFVNTGKTVEPIVSVANWDNQVVHGEHSDWIYTRTVDDNKRALQLILPVLKEAVAKRRALFTKRVGLLQQIIALQQQVIVMLRAKIAAERGNLPILENNQCIHYGKVK